ncbi:hypothetical protein SAMN04489742_0067 [Arthrobacter crystallopoietes]|jgi:hypothetical protein|nr:hypothetical protein SAMN04489742_0067 [Arthrobacter crystallopoietes]
MRSHGRLSIPGERLLQTVAVLPKAAFIGPRYVEQDTDGAFVAGGKPSRSTNPPRPVGMKQAVTRFPAFGDCPF